MSHASGKFSERARHKRAKGCANMHKGIRRARLHCKVKGCLLGADHRGAHYMGED